MAASASASASLTDMAHRFCRAWSGAPDDATPFASHFTPTGTYTDHGFRIVRGSPAHLANHFHIWRTAHPDFQMRLDPQFPVYCVGADTAGDGHVSFRTVNTGTFPGDLPRNKATGRKWGFSGVVDLVVRGGKIEKVDEWYDWSGRTEAGVGEELKLEDWQPGMGYHTLLGEADVDRRREDKV